MSKQICIFCSSSNRIGPAYFGAADKLGQLMAQRGDTLLFGGGQVGLMGAIARAMHAFGGRVVGVIPEKLRQRELAYEASDELIVTPSMNERKAVLCERADAFITLPGGFGTLEEVTEVLTLKQLAYFDKPIVLLNTEGFYNPLLKLFDHFYETHMAHAHHHALYHVAQTPADALQYIDAYTPDPPVSKFESSGA